MLRTPNKIIDFIVKTEGLNQPWKWPGGASGITIGYGFDLGYTTKEQFETLWFDDLPDIWEPTLMSCIGLKGEAARIKAQSFEYWKWCQETWYEQTEKHINITHEMSYPTFIDKCMPIHEVELKTYFPGSEKLPDLAFGALVSLIMNRGCSTKVTASNKNRWEMLKIKEILKNTELSMEIKLKSIAQLILQMRRLWINKGLNGLITRREREAQFISECINNPLGLVKD